MKKYKGTIIAVVVLAVIITVLGINQVTEDGLVRFKVSGKVFDAETEQPLEGVQVMLLLDRWPIEDPRRLVTLFDAYSARWNGKFPGKRMGLSNETGEYVSMGSRKFSREYKTVFGRTIEKGQPFQKAWLVLQKPGYVTGIEEIETAGLVLFSGTKDTNQLPPVYLKKL